MEEEKFNSSLEEKVDTDNIQIKQDQIFTDPGDLEIRSLYDKYKKGKLIVQPSFQRKFVWDNNKSSRLIESALLNIPLPIVYISQGQDNKESVIDGQQRLTSFFNFIDGKFRLSNLNVFSKYNKKSFADLSEEAQDKIQDCKIRTITFRKESNPDLKFEIFERLNTGSESLNYQEIRNCIYRGKYNELLKELSSYNEFRSLMGFSESDNRMKDVEWVLRFCAFYNQNYSSYKQPMKNFLNLEMEKNQPISDTDAAKLKNSFRQTVRSIKSIFGNKAFKRYRRVTSNSLSGHWEPKTINASLYDIMMYSFSQVEQNKVYKNLDAIREAAIHLMTTDEEFINSIEKSSSSPRAVKTRFNKWLSTLNEIVDIEHKEPRCFTRDLKLDLYKQNPTCKICGNKIQSEDDAAVDHIEQYWLGGKTILENARLVHRYCNQSRPRKE